MPVKGYLERVKLPGCTFFVAVRCALSFGFVYAKRRCLSILLPSPGSRPRSPFRLFPFSVDFSLVWRHDLHYSEFPLGISDLIILLAKGSSLFLNFGRQLQSKILDYYSAANKLFQI